MAFFVGATEVVPVPPGNDSTRGGELMSDGDGAAFWGYMGAASGDPAAVDTGQWRYRSIFTHGYLAAGYKGSNPWRSVNKTWHNTDTTLYCGEQLASTQAYTNGVWSDHHAYVMTGGGFSGTSSAISSYSLANGSIRMFTSDGFSSSGVSYGYVGNDPKNEGLGYGTAGYGNHVGGMRMHVNRYDFPAANDIKGQSGWINGGGSADTSRMHFPTEVMYSGWNSGTDGYGCGGHGENRGYFAWTSTYRYVTWANSTWSGTGSWGGYSKDRHCKIQSTKWGHHYIGTGNNVTAGKARFSDATGSTVANFNKVRSYGEDNSEDGQDHGYIMGHFDGQQNNHTIKQTHSSDTETTMGAGCMPKGHYGQSSGACSTGAASILGGIG